MLPLVNLCLEETMFDIICITKYVFINILTIKLTSIYYLTVPIKKPELLARIMIH